MADSKIQKVLIVGAGATGLAAAYELQKRNIEVIVVEKAEDLGGLAGSLKIQGEPLERFYHHLFASDLAAIDLIKELGIGDNLHFYPSNNAIYYDGAIYPFSSPLDMLRFSPVGLIGRLRFAASSAYLKFTNNWKPLERQLALEWLNKWAGRQVTKIVWDPLIAGKFGDRSKDIAMSWLWARIHYRTFKLGYMKGGFQQVYETLAAKIRGQGGELVMGQGVATLRTAKKGVTAKLENGRTITADAAIVTVAEPLFAKMTGVKLSPAASHEHLGATCFTLELDRSIIPYYWLNINDSAFPFLAVVEHTRMVGTEAYNGKHIVYVGNYVPHDDWRFTTDPEELLKKYIPYLKRLNPDFQKSWIKKWHFSRAPFTQPVVTRDYAAQIPPNKTELPHVWLANMAQIYPQDRGQNYAFAMAKKVVKEVLGE
jgi:protoporphyrinogen oxidase